MKNYYPTRHAVLAMQNRDVTWAEILEILEKPEVTYRNTAGPHADKQTHIVQRGTLFVVVADNPSFVPNDRDKTVPMYAIVTVGLRRTQTWTNEDAINRDKETT